MTSSSDDDDEEEEKEHNIYGTSASTQVQTSSMDSQAKKKLEARRMRHNHEKFYQDESPKHVQDAGRDQNFSFAHRPPPKLNMQRQKT